ncbi:hypothetical protein WA026_010092 [Henosepilachna vigintioctopunctata]|uniref:Uncharacterized protein n=1 Tax=Henosepilachna vigintioctopunctata TaxID=420089 RepID=A0AAW1UI66_9CUCU
MAHFAPGMCQPVPPHVDLWSRDRLTLEVAAYLKDTFPWEWPITSITTLDKSKTTLIKEIVETSNMRECRTSIERMWKVILRECLIMNSSCGAGVFPSIYIDDPQDERWFFSEYVQVDNNNIDLSSNIPLYLQIEWIYGIFMDDRQRAFRRDSGYAENIKRLDLALTHGGGEIESSIWQT